MNSTPAHNARGAANRVAAMAAAKDGSPLDAVASSGRPLKPWKPRRMKVRLFQEADEWYVILDGGSPMRATDAEVSLWQALQEAKGNAG